MFEKYFNWRVLHYCPHYWPPKQPHTHDVTANNNKVRKAAERKLLRNSSVVLDVFRLYEDTEPAQCERAGCNPTGRPAALWSKANSSGYSPRSFASASGHQLSTGVLCSRQPSTDAAEGGKGKEEPTCRIGYHNPITHKHTQAPVVPGWRPTAAAGRSWKTKGLCMLHVVLLVGFHGRCSGSDPRPRCFATGGLTFALSIWGLACGG